MIAVRVSRRLGRLRAGLAALAAVSVLVAGTGAASAGEAGETAALRDRLQDMEADARAVVATHRELRPPFEAACRRLQAWELDYEAQPVAVAATAVSDVAYSSAGASDLSLLLAFLGHDEIEFVDSPRAEAVETALAQVADLAALSPELRAEREAIEAPTADLHETLRVVSTAEADLDPERRRAMIEPLVDAATRYLDEAYPYYQLIEEVGRRQRAAEEAARAAIPAIPDVVPPAPPDFRPIDCFGYPREAHAAEPPAAAPDVIESVYGFLEEEAQEAEGYGLYTYLLLPAPGPRNLALLAALFADTPSAADSAISRRQVNIIYLPVHDAADAAARAGEPARLLEERGYHYPRARHLLLERFCQEATPRPVSCRSSPRGPYLLTVAAPLGAIERIGGGYLFLDLSDVHERAFAEFLNAFKAQVMQPDFTDRERIDTMRLTILSIVLTSADWINPIRSGVAEILSVGHQD